MAGNYRSSNEGIHEINITPFVDVALVLLIIVMVTAPAMIAKNMRVQLPKVVNAEDMTHVTLHVEVEPTGKITLDGKPITLDELKQACRQLKSEGVRGDAVVAADKSTTHGAVLTVIDVLREAGIQEIGFGVQTKK